MKTRTILFIAIVIFVNYVNGESNSGKITYEQKSKMNIDIDEEHQELLKDLPKEHISMKELLFDSTASIYKSITSQNHDEEIGSESDKGHMVIKMAEPDDKIYCDLLRKKRIEQRDFMSRIFLIDIPFSESSWKLTGKQKKILNYICQEAVLQDTTKKITAWFTPEIAVSTGPNGVCNLPGLVLAAEFNGGEIVIEAKNIELKSIDHKLIVKPTQGKQVTKQEFNQIVADKHKEMEEQGEGNGNVIIRIRK
jgi:GLPGLI family protein